MKRDPQFKSHKIPGVDKTVCNAEQVIAYNYLFQWASHEKSYAIDCIHRELAAKANGTYNELYHPLHPVKRKYDYDLVYHYILQSWDRYVRQGKPILTSYSNISQTVFSLDFEEG